MKTRNKHNRILTLCIITAFLFVMTLTALAFSGTIYLGVDGSTSVPIGTVPNGSMAIVNITGNSAGTQLNIQAWDPYTGITLGYDDLITGINYWFSSNTLYYVLYIHNYGETGTSVTLSTSVYP